MHRSDAFAQEKVARMGESHIKWGLFPLQHIVPKRTKMPEMWMERGQYAQNMTTSPMIIRMMIKGKHLRMKRTSIGVRKVCGGRRGNMRAAIGTT